MTTIDTTSIKYDRITKDYAVFDDGRPVAFAPSYAQAEAKRVAYLADRRELEYTARALDGGADPDAMAADVVSGLTEPRCVTCGGDGDCPDCEYAPDRATLDRIKAKVMARIGAEPPVLGKGLSPLGKARVGG